MTITTIPAKATAHSLGGAHFFSPISPESSRLFRIDADADPGHPQPITLQVAAAGLRTMVELSIEDAEALGNSLAEAVIHRKAAEAKAAVVQHQRARAFFADSDGPLESG